MVPAEQVGHAIGFIPHWVAGVLRILMWVAVLFLTARMGWRAYRYPPSSHSLTLARMALVALFVSRAVVQVQRWSEPLTWEVAPATVVAIVCVWLAPRI